MTNKFGSSTGEGQSPIDLSGCRFALIPGTRIRLVIPGPDAERRLSIQLGIPGRFKAIRAHARRNLAAHAEVFAQRNYAVGSGFYLSVSLLTTRRRWRGGWLLFRCAAGWKEKLVEYIHAARDAVVADLRKERARHGSKN
jgi:hypothetical protein